MTSPEITIRGAGIFGLSVAWACASRGARVRVIDPGGVGAGASGGLVGALAPHAPPEQPGGWNALKAFQLESLTFAPAWWAAVARAGGRDPGYLASGRVQPLADAAAVALARAREEAARVFWQGRADWTVRPATGAEWEPASPTGLLVHDTLTARLSPRAAGWALEAAIRESGGEILAEAPEAGLVVHATGWRGLADLSRAFDRRIGAGQKGQAALLRPARPAPQVPQIYAGGLHVVSHHDGLVAVGSTSEGEWRDEAPDARAEALADRARALVPALAGAELVECWAGIRPRAASRAPVLGPWPGRAGYFIANGGFKTGFGMAPLLALRLADLMLEGRDAIPEVFRLEVLLNGASAPGQP
ncbi:NAD(P)/FAD-dependent oxidoreductase [Pseudogemmobacter sonorensis]|uniref:NAD(P)/FAD-dependent oxidoreductase n=1 Tax=Pseudogemmobacter sonorensis TaxID=2989681 RepID=UPI0036B3337F